METLFKHTTSEGVEYITLKPNDLSSVVIRKEGNTIEVFTEDILTKGYNLIFHPVSLLPMKGPFGSCFCDPTGVFVYGDLTLFDNRFFEFFKKHKNEVTELINKSGKKSETDRYTDLIIRSKNVEAKQKLLEKMKNKETWDQENPNEILDLIEDIILYEYPKLK